MQEITLDKVPERIAGADISRAKLEPAEGFLLSLIDGKLCLEELKRIVGKPDDELNHMISRLVGFGVIRLKAGGAAHSHGHGQEKLARAILQAASLEDNVRELYMRIDDLDFYSMLGVGRTADNKEIKKAYHQITREYHPDRLFRKGSDEIRERLQYIFARINEAYKTLTNDKTRWEYDKILSENPQRYSSIAPPLIGQTFSRAKSPTPPPIARVPEPEQKPKRLSPPVEPVKPQKPAKNPFAQTVEKARNLYELALREMKKRSFAAAKQNIRIAMTLDPFNKSYPETLQKIESLESKEKGRKYFDEAAQKEKEGDSEEALRLYREATLLDGSNPKYYTKWAKALLEHKQNAQQAKAVVQKAFDLGGKDAEQYLILGLALKDLGQRPQAIAQLEQGLKIAPDNKELQREMKKIKKGK